MIALPAALLFAATAAGAAAEPTHAPIPVPSGAEIWLQETLTDRVPGMGLVQRYRFVMPALDELVPPIPEADMTANLPPADMLDDPYEGDVPLTDAEQAEIDSALGGLVILPAPDQGPDQGPDEGDDVRADGIGGLPPDDGRSDAPLPSDLAAPDATLPDGTLPDSTSPEAPMADGEEAGDLAAIAAGPDLGDAHGDANGDGQGADHGGDHTGDMALPAAPDVLMQDPLHRDIVFLCENFVLPQIAQMSPRPTQVVISMASAPSPFGSFDPAIVQLFEGFSIPKDRNACLWEPM